MTTKMTTTLTTPSATVTTQSTKTTTTCDTIVCDILGQPSCVPPPEICDGQIICDNGADEIPDIFPNNPNCKSKWKNYISIFMIAINMFK